MNCIRVVSIHIAGGQGNKGLHEVYRNVYARCSRTMYTTWPFSEKGVIQPQGAGSEGISQLKKIAALAEIHS